MGQAPSTTNAGKSKSDILAKNGQYKASFLKDAWKGTDREGYRYEVGYAPTGRAVCRQCDKKIAEGALRIGRSVPNPWDAEGGATDYTQYFHAGHAFSVFARSKCRSSKVPLQTSDLRGFGALQEDDKTRVKGLIKKFAERYAAKCNGAKEEGARNKKKVKNDKDKTKTKTKKAEKPRRKAINSSRKMKSS